MNSLDRYLESLKQFLPEEHRDDILSKLEHELRVEMNSRESELGHPLSDADCEAVFARHGAPVSVAGRYRRHGCRLAIGIELIGPDLFPEFVKWLAIPVGITTLLFIAAMLAGKRLTLLQFLFPIGIQALGVTLIFSILQSFLKEEGLLHRWKTSVPGAELVRRYLHAVRFWLPREQRDDIVAELADNLSSEIEEREAALGRRLDVTEIVAILKARGEPVAVASNYLTPRSLIGPALFPIYRFVLKLVVLWILVPAYVLVVGPIVVKTAAVPSLAGIQALWSLFMSSLFSVGVITLIFAIIEMRGRRAPSDWDPRRLPPVPAGALADDFEPLSWYRAAANIAVSVLFALIWVYLVNSGTILEFEGVRIGLAPVWRSLFWPILAVLLSGVAVGAAGLLRPDATRLHAGIRLAATVLSLVVIGFLLRARSWVEISAASGAPLRIEDSNNWTNLGLWISLLIVGVVVLVDGVGKARSLFFPKNSPLRQLAGLGR